MRVAMAWSLKMNTGHVVFAGDVDRLDGGVKTILHAGRGEDDPRGVAVPAKAGDVQVGLLDAGGHAGGRPAALDVAQQ